MKKFFADFKAFITKGNVIDMAVAVIIGGAFGKIVTSLVNDIITPLISLATGKVSLTELKWVISTTTDVNGEIVENALKYGMFIQSIIDFLIIALSIFIVLRIILGLQNKLASLKKKEEEEKKEEAPKETELSVLCEIRDMLNKQNGNGNEE